MFRNQTKVKPSNQRSHQKRSNKRLTAIYSVKKQRTAAQVETDQDRKPYLHLKPHYCGSYRYETIETAWKPPSRGKIKKVVVSLSLMKGYDETKRKGSSLPSVFQDGIFDLK